MKLDRACLNGLELVNNSKKSDISKLGEQSIFDCVNQCVTKGGERLLKKWLL